jgi:putative SOS response-associated peptidase YedK
LNANIGVHLDAERLSASMRWGPIPYWWKKSLKQLPAIFNARVEGVASVALIKKSGQKSGIFASG